MNLLNDRNLYISTTFFPDGYPISKVLKNCKKYQIFNLELGSNHSWEPNQLKIVKSKKFKYLVHNYFPVPKKKFYSQHCIYK